MAKSRARKRTAGMIWHPDVVRQKIRASQLINRLHAHIFDGLELEMTQIRAIEILLRKCIPDLSTTTVTADVTHRYVVELPPMLSREEWERKYGHDHLDPSPAPLQITNGNGKLQ